MVNSGANPNTYGLHILFAAATWMSVTLVIVCSISYMLVFLRKFLVRRRQIKTEFVLLEITPPLTTEKSSYATSQLFSIIHLLLTPRSLRERLLGRYENVALEIVSTRKKGIRYHIRVPQKSTDALKRDIAAYLPGAQCKKVTDYQDPYLKNGHFRAVEFRQTGHPFIPLQSQDNLNHHDPVAYLTGAMTQLKAGELIVFQLILTPAATHKVQKYTYEASKNVVSAKKRRSTFIVSLLIGLMRIVKFCSNVLLRSFKVLQIMVLDLPGYHKTPAVHYSKFDGPMGAQFERSIQEKIDQPLFETTIRALVVTKDRQSSDTRIHALESSLASFDQSGKQSLRAKQGITRGFLSSILIFNIRNRLPSILSTASCLLSAAEVADMYHFPYSRSAQAENVITSLSRSLPAPVSLKTDTPLDVILGTSLHNGLETPIGLTAAERERHVYIVGGTGNGKTTMLLYAIEQDIRRGKGLAVIDPHGDLAESVLKYIPKNRIKDVIYFNPDDVSYPIGLNLLELPQGLTGHELIREKDLITETVISVFRKIFSDDDNGGHRIEYILRNTIQTALTIEGATLFTIFRLLTNNKYRKTAVEKLQDPDLRDFWNNEIGKAGEFQRIKMTAGITAKVGRFLFSGSAKRILGQPKSTIDFEEVINSGKILICNVSKGLLGEDTAALFGITVLAKLQIATLRRARISPDNRQPFYLYVDEFQNFATMSFVQLLSEARKYKLFLSMAEQSTSQQQEQRIVNIILANVGTVISFRSASPADEQFLLPVFAPFITEGEMSYLAPFHFFIRIAAMRSQAPFSGSTTLLQNPGTQSVVEKVVQSSRELYAASENAEVFAPSMAHDIDDYEIDYPLVTT